MPKHKFTEQTQKQIIDIMTDYTTNLVKRLEEGKTINVIDLPDCIHKSRYTNIVQDAKQSKVVAIAALNETDGTWEAYIGWPDVRDLKVKAELPELDDFDWLWFCENIRDAEQVKMLGDKLSKDVAEILFPDWKSKPYKVR